jgi:hypothetical protein
LLSPGFANLSFAPLAAFEAVNQLLAEPYYEPHVVSPGGGPIVNSFGMIVQSERAERRIHTGRGGLARWTAFDNSLDVR